MAIERATRVGAKLFAEHGYAATSTRQLSRGLGVTNGTFYHYFASKEDLLKQICDKSLTRITNAVSTAVEAESTPESKLTALIHAHVVTMLADQDLHKTMLMEIRSLNGDYRSDVIEKRDAYSKIVRQVLTLGQRQGFIRNDTSPRVLTLLLLNMLNWTIFWYTAGAELTADDLARAATETFVKGAATT